VQNLRRQLELHDWPGNVRELENVIRRALALSTGLLLGPQHLAVAGRFKRSAERNGTLQSGVTLQEMERRLLEKTLEATGGKPDPGSGIDGREPENSTEQNSGGMDYRLGGCMSCG